MDRLRREHPCLRSSTGHGAPGRNLFLLARGSLHAVCFDRDPIATVCRRNELSGVRGVGRETRRLAREQVALSILLLLASSIFLLETEVGGIGIRGTCAVLRRGASNAAGSRGTAGRHVGMATKIRRTALAVARPDLNYLR